MKTNKIIVLTFIFIALNTNSFAKPNSDSFVNIIKTQNMTLDKSCNLAAFDNSGRNLSENTIVGRNKESSIALKSIKKSDLLHIKISKRDMPTISEPCGSYDVSKRNLKGRNEYATGL